MYVRIIEPLSACTRMNSINNHSKLGPRVAHKADFLRRSRLTEERLNRNINNGYDSRLKIYVMLQLNYTKPSNDVRSS